MTGKPRRRKTLFASLAVIAGLMLIGSELARPPAGTTTGERWFWFVVGVLLIGLGLSELMSSRDGNDAQR